MNIIVLDGQGGGIGKAIILKFKDEIKSDISITALGTNPKAAEAMLKCGADRAFYGEKQIIKILTLEKPSALIGPIGMLCPGGLNNEITPAIAEVIFSIDCPKYIIPLRRHGFIIPGSTNLELKEIFDMIIKEMGHAFE